MTKTWWLTFLSPHVQSCQETFSSTNGVNKSAHAVD